MENGSVEIRNGAVSSCVFKNANLAMLGDVTIENVECRDSVVTLSCRGSEKAAIKASEFTDVDLGLDGVEVEETRVCGGDIRLGSGTTVAESRIVDARVVMEGKVGQVAKCVRTEFDRGRPARVWISLGLRTERHDFLTITAREVCPEPRQSIALVEGA